MMGRMEQDFVLNRTKSIGNSCSMGVDFRGKGVYIFYTRNDRQQTQALIESIEYLALRLLSAVHVRQQSVEALAQAARTQL
jgi:hypothetical protein